MATTEQSLRTLRIDTQNKISIIELTELHNDIEKILAGSIGVSAAYHAVHKGFVYSSAEERELSKVYADILADLKLNPSELKEKIDYYQDREMPLRRQAEELEEKIRERYREIIERKRTEEKLTDSEEIYRTLVENVNIGVYRNTGGSHGHFLQANPAMLKIFGYESFDDFRKIYVSDLYQQPEERALSWIARP